MDIYACMMKNINMMFYKYLLTGILPYLHDTNCQEDFLGIGFLKYNIGVESTFWGMKIHFLCSSELWQVFCVRVILIQKFVLDFGCKNVLISVINIRDIQKNKHSLAVYNLQYGI